MQINLRVSRDVNVGGTGNTVIINEALEPTQKGLTLAERTLAALVALSYPLFGSEYNAILHALAVIAIPLSIVAFITTVRGYGPARASDMLYIAGSVLTCWLVSSAIPYLDFTAQRASQIYPSLSWLFQQIGEQFSQGLFSMMQASRLPQILFAVLTDCFAVAGFAFLFLALARFMFAYLTARGLNRALHFFFQYGGMAIVAYLVACSSLFALLIPHDFGYIKGVILTAWPQLQ